MGKSLLFQCLSNSRVPFFASYPLFSPRIQSNIKCLRWQSTHRTVRHSITVYSNLFARKVNHLSTSLIFPKEYHKWVKKSSENRFIQNSSGCHWNLLFCYFMVHEHYQPRYIHRWDSAKPRRSKHPPARRHPSSLPRVPPSLKSLSTWYPCERPHDVAITW